MHALWRVSISGAALAAMALSLQAQQPSSPDLTRQQRGAMQALIGAVDTNLSNVHIEEADWPVHLLRASDGSHYVAFSMHRVAGLVVGRPILLYVRLATRRTSSDVSSPERSAVAEWLAGQMPVPIVPRRGIAIGQMPTYGASGISRRDPLAETQNLQLLDLERERAREKREAQARERKAALEGEETARVTRPLLPFEDFDLKGAITTGRSGEAVLRRSLTAGPGNYELTVAWTDADTKPGTDVKVARRSLSLPPASTSALALSSVIVADDVRVRETPVSPTDQTAHPYSIGPTEITPAGDHVLSAEERLALVVQVINARGSPSGKPDVEVGFRVFRRNGAREENIGTLAPQSYNELTLPLDFDVNKGHPVFAAVSVPLATFKRGDYRMAITANDRIAGAGVVTDVHFTIAATAATLLREAPPLAPAFDPKAEALPATIPIMLGSIRASEGNDREAIVAWQAAIEGGADSLTLWPVMIDASLRLGDPARAVDLATRALAGSPRHARVTRQLAKAHMMAGRYREALQTLDAYLESADDDLAAQWLALHVLYASLVAGAEPGVTAEGRARIVDMAARYISASGPHAALARDWAAVVR